MSGSSPPGTSVGRYSHIQVVLKRFTYPRLKRADKGLGCAIWARAGAIRGNSGPAWRGSAWPPAGSPSATVPPAQSFTRKFTGADVALLAETDALHDTLSGAAPKHLMRRVWRVIILPQTFAC